MSKLYGIYDISYHEQCVMITNRVREVAKYLNKTEHYIHSVILYEKIVGKHYKVIYIGDERDIDDLEV